MTRLALSLPLGRYRLSLWRLASGTVLLLWWYPSRRWWPDRVGGRTVWRWCRDYRARQWVVWEAR